MDKGIGLIQIFLIIIAIVRIIIKIIVTVVTTIIITVMIRVFITIIITIIITKIIIIATLGGAKKPKVRNLMGALLIPILLVLGCSEQFSKLS